MQVDETKLKQFIDKVLHDPKIGCPTNIICPDLKRKCEDCWIEYLKLG